MKAREGLVLRAVAVERDGDAHTFRVQVRPDHPAFAGHFPGHPVLPGMDVVGVVTRAAGEVVGEPLRLRRIDRVRLTRPIAPGSELVLSIRTEPGGASVGVDARLCDDVGLDTIETGAAIGIYMDAGKMDFGDSEGAKRLIREIGEGTELGKIIGDGADTTGRATNHPRVPTVRGQAIPAWDPRPLLATGVTYASSAQGADHTAGLVTDTSLKGDALAHAS